MSSNSDDSLPPPMPEPVGVPPVAPQLSSHSETLLAQLAGDFLRERRLERRWRTVFRLFWLLLAGLLVYSLWLQGRHVTPSTAPRTLRTARTHPSQCMPSIFKSICMIVSKA